MKNFFLWILGGLLFLLIIPTAVVMFGDGQYRSVTEITPKVSVYVKNEDKTVEMDTEEYLKGVVAAEMPAEFGEEALKAQAVAARTYLLSRMNASKKDGAAQDHKGGVICTNYAHCQAWMSETDRKNAWEKEKAQDYWKKISKAVEDTAGQVMLYNNEPISAVFHSTSSGKTENAQDVWSGSVAYLVSVESPGEEQSPKFLDEVSITEDTFKQKAAEAVDGVNEQAPLLENIVRSEAGGVKTADLLGVNVKGTQIRTIYGLRSTNFEFSNENGNVTFQTKGNGHGVGMSQYGANYMAGQGKGFEEILKHYYTGVEIKNCAKKES